MRKYTFSEARQKLAEVLDAARTDDVLVQRRGGETFVISVAKKLSSPFDNVPVVAKGRVTTKDIIDAVRSSRAQPWRDKLEKSKNK